MLLPHNKYSYVTIAISLCCLIAAYYSLRIGIADTQAYKAKYLLEKWEKEHRLPTKEEADDAVEKVTLALEWEPDNTEYMDLKAHVLTYKGLLYWNKGMFTELTDESVRLYLNTTKRRPKWPYAWARLALVKAYRNEHDKVFFKAIHHAVKYGPWEPGVQKTITEAGLYAWTSLDKQSRISVVANIQRGLNFEFEDISATIQRFKRTASVCGYLAYTKHSKKLCGW